MVIGMDHVRQPKGAPTGGQFAGKSNPEGGVSLSDKPPAKVRGDVSTFAAGLAADARRSEQEALAEAALLADQAKEIADKAANLRAKAETKGRIVRWSSTRKAKKSDRSAANLRVMASRSKETAKAAGDEAGRMQAGVDAEQAVVDTLAHTDGVHHVLCGLNLGPGIGDIDVIAVGDAVVIAEVKAGRGDLEAGSDGTVSHGGRPTPKNPLAQCAAQVETLREKSGVEVVGAVCFPEAEPSVTYHRQSGCYLIGGTDNLSDFVAHTMADSDAGPINAKAVVTSVQGYLAARHEEVTDWVDNCHSQDAAAAARIAKWETTISRSSGWSKGPEIRGNLTRMIAENRAQMSERQEKIAGWSDLAARVSDAYEGNKKILNQR